MKAATAARLLVARRSWRTGWRTQLVLALTTAFAVAVVLALVVGAQRTDSALARLRAESHAGDLAIGSGEGADAAAAVAAADWVEASGVAREMFVRPVGSDLFPDYQLLALAAPSASASAPVDVPVVITGRAPDPTAVDEVALSEPLADDLGVAVGDVIALESMTFDWVEVAFNGQDPGPPDGPVVDVTVVGLARTPADFGRWASTIHLTPAFADRYQDEIRTYTFVEARLTDELSDQLRAGELSSLPGLEDIEEVGDSYFASSDATQDGLQTISTGLLLVAAASALAGLIVVALTSLRLARETVADRTTLVSIGWTRSEMGWLVLTVLAPWVVAGAGAGLLLGVLASPRASIGLARSVDPAGNDLVLSGATLAVGAMAALALLAGVLVLASVRASRAADRPATGEWAVPPLRRPLAIPLGLRRALFGAPDRGGRASRGALVAATAAVTVAVGALLVGASIQRLHDDPVLSGQGPADQRSLDTGDSYQGFVEAMATLEDDERIADLAGVHVAFGVRAPGVAETTALILDVRRGDIGASLLSGRAPAQPDEVAVGPATLEQMDLAVGDEVELSTEAGSDRFRIVGEVLFPEGDFQHDSGVVVTPGGADFVGGVEDGAELHQVVLRWGPDVDVAAADQSLTDHGYQIFATGEGLVPPVVANLEEVAALPGLLAVLVLAFSLVTALHAVALSTRLRTHEAGTLRALGMTRRAVGSMVEVHGAAVSLIALGVGIPLGIAVGRQVWSQIASRAHVLDHPVPAWAGMSWMALGLLVGMAVLVVPSAVRLLHQRPATALRSE